MTRKAPRIRTLAPRVQVMAIGLPIKGLHRTDAGGQGLYTYKWKMARLRFLRAHPLCQCEDCDGKRATPSEVVDHVIPHRGDLELFWRESNWMAMAKVCHDRKTATEDGGFGNVPRF